MACFWLKQITRKRQTQLCTMRELSRTYQTPTMGVSIRRFIDRYWFKVTVVLWTESIVKSLIMNKAWGTNYTTNHSSDPETSNSLLCCNYWGSGFISGRHQPRDLSKKGEKKLAKKSLLQIREGSESELSNQEERKRQPMFEWGDYQPDVKYLASNAENR